jgi:hypothetical protein
MTGRRLGTEFMLSGIHRTSASVPGIPLGEVAARIGVRPGALRALVVSGALQAIDNGQGGLYFDSEQERAAVERVYALGLVRPN